ncbi:MAG: hypothetical protein R3E65_08745 [Steroidobacteraceae bacterium]
MPEMSLATLRSRSAAVSAETEIGVVYRLVSAQRVAVHGHFFESSLSFLRLGGLADGPDGTSW